MELKTNINLFLEQLEEQEAFPIANRLLLNLKKGEILELASEILQQVNDGILDDVDAKIFAKKGLTFFEALNDGLGGKVELPQEKDYKKHGCTMRMQDTGVRYDYSACGHPVIDEVNQFISEHQASVKIAENVLKSLKSEQEIVDEETGETFTVKPPIRTSSRSVIITFDK